MIGSVSFDVNHIAGNPPMKFFACDDDFVKGTCVIDLPFGVERSEIKYKIILYIV